ncbi:MAG: hypothetical protein M1814_006627 [Vezdaea aestivalis]|nr:MAG: hypothetical protein M1814_006627 [Vezdaea aestivalis]
MDPHYNARPALHLKFPRERGRFEIKAPQTSYILIRFGADSDLAYERLPSNNPYKSLHPDIAKWSEKGVLSKLTINYKTSPWFDGLNLNDSGVHKTIRILLFHIVDQFKRSPLPASMEFLLPHGMKTTIQKDFNVLGKLMSKEHANFPQPYLKLHWARDGTFTPADFDFDLPTPVKLRPPMYFQTINRLIPQPKIAARDMIEFLTLQIYPQVYEKERTDKMRQSIEAGAHEFLTIRDPNEPLTSVICLVKFPILLDQGDELKIEFKGFKEGWSAMVIPPIVATPSDGWTTLRAGLPINPETKTHFGIPNTFKVYSGWFETAGQAMQGIFNVPINIASCTVEQIDTTFTRRLKSAKFWIARWRAGDSAICEWAAVLTGQQILARGTRDLFQGQEGPEFERLLARIPVPEPTPDFTVGLRKSISGIVTVEGPPGTGKTYLGGKLISTLPEREGAKILIVAPSSGACGAFVRELFKEQEQNGLVSATLMRLYTTGKESDNLKRFSEQQKMKARTEGLDESAILAALSLAGIELDKNKRDKNQTTFMELFTIKIAKQEKLSEQDTLEYKKLWDQYRAAALQMCSIVVATPHAASDQFIAKNFRAQTIFVDEAGLMPEIDVVMVIGHYYQNLNVCLFLGDTRQLQPIVLSNPVEIGFDPCLLTEHRHQAGGMFQLWNRIFYEGLLKDVPEVTAVSVRPKSQWWCSFWKSRVPHKNTMAYPEPWFPAVFCDVEGETQGLDEGSKLNRANSAYTCMLLKDIITAMKASNGLVEARDITILVPYLAQKKLTEESIRLLAATHPDLCSSISDVNGRGHFMDPKRSCVALSRALDGMAVIGHLAGLETFAKSYEHGAPHEVKMHITILKRLKTYGNWLNIGQIDQKDVDQYAPEEVARGSFMYDLEKRKVTHAALVTPGDAIESRLQMPLDALAQFNLGG